VGSAGQRGKRARGREKRRRQAWPTRSERERERGRAGVGVDRRGPPVRHRGRTGAGARGGARLSVPVWTEIGFPFSREFLIAFLFIFSRVFNSNSNQVSISNQIKYVQQFKEYLGSIRCNIT
jgi:hypothetical protein